MEDKHGISQFHDTGLNEGTDFTRNTQKKIRLHAFLCFHKARFAARPMIVAHGTTRSVRHTPSHLGAKIRE